MSIACTFLMLSTILSFTTAIAQKKALKIELVDSADNSYKNYVFAITITNKSARKLIIQDTSFMKDHVEYPHGNLITPYFYRKIGSQYVFVDAIPRPGVALPNIDSCLEKCCGCITLKKKESLTMRLKILSCCPLDPGFYKLVIGLRQPFMGMKKKYLRGEIESNEIYFSIK